MFVSKKKLEEEAEEDKKKKHVSKMDAKLMSFTTFYYFVRSISFCHFY